MDWARTPFVRAVEVAYAWSQMPGGPLAAVYQDSPAVLFDAVMFLAGEIGARDAHEWEQRRADAERANGHAQDG